VLRYTLYWILLAIPLLPPVHSALLCPIIPGDPVTAMLGVQANPELVVRLKAQYGFDKPIEQYPSGWSGRPRRLRDLVQDARGRPILADRIPATLQLMAPVVSLGIAIPVGITAGCANDRA
jgi:peptide/nickel transport system permease protein